MFDVFPVFFLFNFLFFLRFFSFVFLLAFLFIFFNGYFHSGRSMVTRVTVGSRHQIFEIVKFLLRPQKVAKVRVRVRVRERVRVRVKVRVRVSVRVRVKVRVQVRRLTGGVRPLGFRVKFFLWVGFSEFLNCFLKCYCNFFIF